MWCFVRTNSSNFWIRHQYVVSCAGTLIFSNVTVTSLIFLKRNLKKRKELLDETWVQVGINFSGISNLSARNNCTITIPLVFDDFPWTEENDSFIMLVCGFDSEFWEKFIVSLLCNHNTYIVPSYLNFRDSMKTQWLLTYVRVNSR